MGNRAVGSKPPRLAASSEAPSPSRGERSERPPCRYFMSGYCRDGAQCRFDHGSGSQGVFAQLRPISQRSEEQLLLYAQLLSLKDRITQEEDRLAKERLIADFREILGRLILLQSQQHEQPSDSTSRVRGERRLQELFPSVVYDPAVHDNAGADESRVVCVICTNEYVAGESLTILPCIHWFHRRCIALWLQKKPECPICKHDVNNNSVPT